MPWAALAVSLVVAFVWKAQCLDESRWTGGGQHEAYCYSDPAALWFTRGFSEGAVPYLDEAFEYPPLIGLQVWALAGVTRAVGGGVGWFFTLNAVAHALAAGGVLHLLGRIGLSDRRRLWWAAGPPLVLYAFLNWDLPAILLLVLAVHLHTSGRDGRAGVAAGLGAAAKLFPLILVPLVVIARLRSGDPRTALRHLGGAVLAWSAVNLPLAVAAPEGWARFFEASRERGATNATLYALVGQAVPEAVDPGFLNPVSSALLLVGGAALLARHRVPAPATWTLALPLFAWFLLVNKVFSPQFDLWMLALLVLAGRAPTMAAFVVADLAVFFAEFSYVGGRLDSYAPLGVAVALRAGVLAWIALGPLRSQRQPGSHIRASEALSASGTPNQIGER